MWLVRSAWSVGAECDVAAVLTSVSAARWEKCVTDLSKALASEENQTTEKRIRESETRSGSDPNREEWSRTVFVPQVHHVALLQLVQGRQCHLGPVHQII